MLISLSCRTAVIQSVAAVYLTRVVPLGAVSHKFDFFYVFEKVRSEQNFFSVVKIVHLILDGYEFISFLHLTTEMELIEEPRVSIAMPRYFSIVLSTGLKRHVVSELHAFCSSSVRISRIASFTYFIFSL